jgi:YD repeat-containing protein
MAVSLRPNHWGITLDHAHSGVDASLCSRKAGNISTGDNAMRTCGWIAHLGLAVLVLISEQCYAQAAPESEYKQLINVQRDVQPLKANPFGEQVNLYNGALSFAVTDISQPGTGPELTLGRSLQIAEDVHNTDGIQRPFGEWRLNIPRIETNTAFQANVLGWDVGNVGDPGYLNRCTLFRDPPPVQATIRGFAWNSTEWWYGYHLVVPGYGDQILMPRKAANTHTPTISGMSFPIVTKQDWMIACGVTASDGGEGFLAIAPDGTRYTFAHLVYRPMTYLQKPYDAAPNVVGGMHPMEESSNILTRREASMYVTRIQDRFGNTLTYNWNGDNLDSIVASDERKLTLSYVAGTPLIHTATLQALDAPVRTWTYSYNDNAVFPSLTGVQLPDGGAWSYQIGDLESTTLATQSTICDSAGDLHAQPAVGSMTHPSGLMATFTVTPILHGRSYVPRYCRSYSGSTKTYANIPSLYYQYSVTQEVLSGAGITIPQIWAWSYSPPNQSWLSDACASGGTCPSTIYTDVTDPGKRATRYTFSNRYDVTEGQLKRTDYYSGAAGSSISRSVSNTYADPTAGPWPVSYGDDLQNRDNFDQVEQSAPLQKRDIAQDGDTYTWEAEAFNQYAQVTKTKRCNSIVGQIAYCNNGSGGLEEQTDYLNNTAYWVLGLPLKITNLGTGEAESENTYNTNATLAARKRFGQLLMSYGYDTQGNLSSFTDGNSNKTTLTNYKRGIPQLITFPAVQSNTYTESRTVDDLGRITAFKDRASNTTHYQYDPVTGRLNEIDYPTGDTVAWNATRITFAPVGTGRGLSGTHWVQTVTRGASHVDTYYDALLRPVLTDTYGGSFNATTLRNYDWKSEPTFESYPDSSPLNFTTTTSAIKGIYSSYDALERLKQVDQDSELGTLSTKTEYLSSASVRTMDPKTYVTTRSYQVFDQPSYDAVIKVVAPEGVNQAITRDVYGNPTAIRQYGSSGAWSGDITKSLAYDSYHRLCRTTEPESGSALTHYDGANNVDWTTEGLINTVSLGDTACHLEWATDAAKTSLTYDAMNRVTDVQPPAGTQSTHYDYDPLGNVQSSTSGIVLWDSSRNKLGLLKGEDIAVNGLGSRGLAYTYDANGSLKSVEYPNDEVVDYAPDALGRPTKAGSYASGVSYYADGGLSSFNYGNGATYSGEQNTRHLLSNFSVAKGSALNLSEDLIYDANGNITRVDDLVNGQRDKSFGYDGLNRLTSSDLLHLGGAETWQYDPLNNIRQHSAGTWVSIVQINGRNQQVGSTVGGSPYRTYTYDDNRGNITTRTDEVNHVTQSYLFDQKNQLTDVIGHSHNDYDAAGRRVAKTVNGATTYYFYNEAGRLMYQYDSATTQGTNHIYLGQKMIARNAFYQTAIAGNIDGVTVDGSDNATVNGWACSTGLTSSINVDLYVGGPAGSGTAIGRYTANLASEAAVATACGVTSGSFRFKLPLSSATRSLYGGSAIYIHGISPVGVGNSLLSGSGSYVVPAVAGAPMAPASLTATVAGDLGSIGISWPASSGATSYTLQKQFNGGTWAGASSGAGTSYTLGSPADGSYKFQVQACNGTNCSLWTASNTVTVAHVPAQPASITVPATSSGSLTVTWTSATYATSYTLQQRLGTGAWSTVYTGAATSKALTLTASGSYTFQVMASNSQGNSAWKVSGAVAVTIPPASAPTLTAPTSSTTGSYAVSWTAASGATSYTLQEQVNAGAWVTIQTANSLSKTISGKVNGSYGYRAQGCNIGGCGPWSSVKNVVVTLIPATPTGLTATLYVYDLSGAMMQSAGTASPQTRRYAYQLSASWAASAGATSYTFQYCQSGGPCLTQSVSTTSASAAVVVNSVSVQACNASGCSAYSAAVSPTVVQD